MSHNHDILIAGGGLVGGSLALALAESGLRVAVIEALPEPQRLQASAGDRALALSWGSVQILDQLRVWQQARARAFPIKTIHVSDRGHFGKVRLRAEQEGVPALGYVITARDLEEAIAAVLRSSQIEVLAPARVIGVKAGGDAVHVSLKLNDESVSFSARLLVAADGGNSTVRKLLDIGQTSREYGQTAIVAEVETEKPNLGTAYERFTGSGPLALLPVAKNKSALVWTQHQADAEALLDLPEADFQSRLQADFGYWLGHLRQCSRRQAFPLKLIRAERMVDERVVLIGNAMHQLHPVAGQGLNLGLRDVAVLAERLLAQWQFQGDIGERNFLQRYADVRRADLEKVVRVTDSTVRIFSNEFWPLAVTRNLAMLGLDHFAGAKSLLARHAMGLAGGVTRFR